jgi:hypothetical protein
MEDNNLEFYLGQLNVATNSNMATLINGEISDSFSGDATVHITTVSASTMRNLFTFGTDTVDINDLVSENLLYKVNWTDNSNNPLDIDIDISSNVATGNIVSGVTNQNLTCDFIRYLAVKLFKTVNGVSFLSNKQSLRSNIKNQFNITLNNRLLELEALGSLTDSDITNNPVRTVVKQMLLSDPGRFYDMSSDLYYGLGADLNGNVISMNKVPFIPGDIVYFNVIVNAANEQHTIVNRDIPIPGRIYLFKLTLQ